MGGISIGEHAWRQAVEAWLAARLPGAAVHVGATRQPQGSGFSAETVIFDATVERDGHSSPERYVLRRETPDPAVYPQQVPGLDVEIDIQYRVMRALGAHASVPVAPLIGYEPDAGVLGAPFFVMGYVEGLVPIESPLYTHTGFFFDATPEQRRTLVEDGLRMLAGVHALDWRGAGLDWLAAPGAAPGTAQQLDIWERYARRELGDREHPLLDHAFAWLHANVAPDPSPAGLCWGDARPGNMIWREFRCVCLTDFEAACIAVPEHDLGWWLMFDRWVHESLGAARLPGEPTREEQRALYARYAGCDPPDTAYHEVFAAARYAAIVVRVMNRAVARGDMPPDQTVWRDNPVVPCLAQLLEEHT